MIEQIDRLKTFQKLALPAGIGRDIHQNRLLKMAREGGRMTPQDLAKFEVKRRYATLVALALEGTATVTDQLIDLHDRILVKMFSTAKHKHHQQFQDKGKAINDKVRLYSKVGHALLDAKESDSDPFEAIEKVISWEDFMLSITEADQLSQPESFDHLHLVTESFNMLRRYTLLVSKCTPTQCCSRRPAGLRCHYRNQGHECSWFSQNARRCANYLC